MCSLLSDTIHDANDVVFFFLSFLDNLQALSRVTPSGLQSAAPRWNSTTHLCTMEASTCTTCNIYTHTHAHTLTHICMHKHTHATLNWHRGLPTIAQESGCTLVHSTEEEVHHQECVCLCVREMAGGVKSGCLHHLGKVAASASLLVTRKMWKHSLPPPYCWWSHGFTFLWHIIIFFFCN